MDTTNAVPQKTGFLTGISNILQSPISGLISGGLNLLGQHLQNKQTNRQIRDQNTANMELAKYQYGQQMEMWNKANQYNSPEQQMARFKSAGLNPNLIYGQGSSGNAPNVAPQYHAPERSMAFRTTVDMPEVLGAYQDYQIKNAQLENLKAQRRVIEADATRKDKYNFFANDIFGSQAKNLFETATSKYLDRILRLDVTDENYKFRPEYLNSVYAKWRQPAMMLEKYHTDIALANARKDMIDIERQNYLPPWIREAIGVGKTLIGAGSGLLRGKISGKRNLPPASPRLQNYTELRTGRNAGTTNRSYY